MLPCCAVLCCDDDDNDNFIWKFILEKQEEKNVFHTAQLQKNFVGNKNLRKLFYSPLRFSFFSSSSCFCVRNNCTWKESRVHTSFFFDPQLTQTLSFCFHCIVIERTWSHEFLFYFYKWKSIFECKFNWNFFRLITTTIVLRFFHFNLFFLSLALSLAWHRLRLFFGNNSLTLYISLTKLVWNFKNISKEVRKSHIFV